MTRRFNHQEFVEKYLDIVKRGGTTADFAEAIGTDLHVANSRKSALMKKGLTFPPMKRGHEISSIKLQKMQKMLDGTDSADDEQSQAKKSPQPVVSTTMKQPPAGVA